MVNLKIGKILRKHRLKNQYTQQDVADILHIENKSTLGSWEVGKSEPDAETFLKLCNIYKIDDITKAFLDNNRKMISSECTDIESETSNPNSLSIKEKQIITAYRKNPDMHKAVERILNISSSADVFKVAAMGKGTQKVNLDEKGRTIFDIIYSKSEE